MHERSEKDNVEKTEERAVLVENDAGGGAREATSMDKETVFDVSMSLIVHIHWQFFTLITVLKLLLKTQLHQLSSEPVSIRRLWFHLLTNS